ncbi:phosphate signaling complex protein PhoU [soil metagenome]
MPHQLRKAFNQELDEIDAKVTQLFALVTEGLAAATDTFLAGDRVGAREVVGRDALIDSLYGDIEELVQRVLLLQSPVASDLRYLLSVLRIVPELERSGDLAEHIASRAARGLGAQLTPTVRGMVEEMGNVGVTMWRAAADAYADRDGEAAAHLDHLDDRLDTLHDELSALLAGGALELPAAIEMALVARFYERLGDHALHITERIRYLALGTRSVRSDT